MKIVLLSVLLFIGFALCVDEYPYLPTNPIQWPSDPQSAFTLFKSVYNKVYTAEEEPARFAIFKQNLVRAQQFDAISLREAARRNDSLAASAARYGVTKYSDLTPGDFRARYLVSDVSGPRPIAPGTWNRTQTGVVDPKCVSGRLYDWGICHFVTGVYNQGDCGSCWAFSTTEQLESLWAIAGHGLRELSAQQLVSCDRMSDGCGGGSPANAWEYIHSAGGQDSLASYPYTARNTPCDFKKADIVAKIRDWVYVTTTRNENEMHNYLTERAPMSVCVDAERWQYYTGGVILRGTCGVAVDHCVQITGRDSDVDGHEAWHVRNSWGTDWGIYGYLWVEAGYDVCAIATFVTSANVA